MQIQSTRFGTVEIRDDAVLTFPHGLPGLPGNRWALITKGEDSPFLWLHSIDYADVAVPVTSPWQFFSNYEVRVDAQEARTLELEDPADSWIMCVVRAGEKLADFTINLACPIVINTTTRIGCQMLNAQGGYSVRHPLFSEVELDQVAANREEVPVAAAVG